MHYLVEGPENGAAVVLVHGLGGSAEDWRNLAPYLAKAGFRVYIPICSATGAVRGRGFLVFGARRGRGRCGFMDTLGLKQVDLGGWSMGGWIVELMAAEHPERISRLMLFDAAGLDVKPDWDTAVYAHDAAQLASWKLC